MSKLTEELRSFGIGNAHDFANARGVLNANYPFERPAPRCRVYGEHRIVPTVYYMTQQPGRGYKSACWQVGQGSIPTDPDAHWRDNGHKTFDVRRKDKAEQLQAALAWASERFGVTAWKRDPFGTWMPAEFVDMRLAELRAWMKSLKEQEPS